MIKYPEIKKYCERVLYPTKTCGVSAVKKYQIDKKFFFQLTNILNQITNFTSFLLKNIFLKKISIWYFFPALTPCWIYEFTKCNFLANTHLTQQVKSINCIIKL